MAEVRPRHRGGHRFFANLGLAAQGLLMQLGSEPLMENLAHNFLNAPEIVVEDVICRRAVRPCKSYLSERGPVTSARGPGRPRGGDCRANCPLKERVGMLAGYWTLCSALEAAGSAVPVMPWAAEIALGEMTGKDPPKTSADHPPATVSAVRGADRVAFETTLRQGETMATEATTVAVFLDGVLAPVRDGKRTGKRA